MPAPLSSTGWRRQNYDRTSPNSLYCLDYRLGDPYYFKDLLAATLAAGLFSFLISLEFYILQAPDVAISQAAIGAGLTTAIFIIAIRATGG